MQWNKSKLYYSAATHFYCLIDALLQNLQPIAKCESSKHLLMIVKDISDFFFLDFIFYFFDAESGGGTSRSSGAGEAGFPMCRSPNTEFDLGILGSRPLTD